MPSKHKLKSFYDRVTSYRFPEDLFGELGETKEEQLANLEKKFNELSLKYHPEEIPGFCDYLNSLKDEAVDKIGKGIYGLRANSVKFRSGYIIETATDSYRIFEKLAEDVVADVYRGEIADSLIGAEVSLKLARDPSDNSLMENEQKMLLALLHHSLPRVIDRFTTTEGNAGTILKYVDGYDLEAVRERPKWQKLSLEERVEHSLWILERLLAVLGYCHSKMIIHGNIEPGNIIVRARDHNAFLIDFAFALDLSGFYFDGTTSPPYIPVVNEFSAPEVSKKVAAMPAADIYALGQSMVYLLGGDSSNGELPEETNPKVKELLAKMTVRLAKNRANDAWKLWGKLKELRTELYGDKRFTPLDL